ncbi:MAG: BACON domain-containing protein [Blastocatellales bacterium]
MKNRFLLITALLFVLALLMFGNENKAVVNGSAAVADLTCSSATTLESLATCIRGQMPQSGSNGFVAPNAAEQADWRAVVNQMLQGQCDFTLPNSLSGAMRISTFTDSGNGRNYCVLMEVQDANNNGYVDRGWGTFIVYNNATRELSHQAPHPISDSTTENQAITIFKETDSRSYLMSGAHRSANSASSSCQSSYGSADAAHNVNNMFHAANQELINWYGATAWNAIQWHGMAADTCSNTHVYPTHGMNITPLATDKISELRDNVLVYHPAWDVDLPGAGACSLNATDNTQGRLINGVPAGSVCGTAASSYNGRFIHIEQDPSYRNPADWINPVKDTWLVGCSYSISPTSASYASAGGAGSVGVTSGAGCAWTVVSNDAWITITSGGSGAGNGTVNYSVAANSGSARTGTMIIAGQTFAVMQSAPTLNTGWLSPAANAAVTSQAGDNNGYEVSAANAGADDNLYAVDNNSGTGSSTSCAANSKDKHRFYNYGVSITGAVAIKGIEVQLNAKVDSASKSPRLCVQLSWDGGVTWTATKSTATLSISEMSYVLGGAADTWGRTWSVGNFSNANFRVRIVDVANSTSRDFSLDWVSVRVSYQP